MLDTLIAAAIALSVYGSPVSTTQLATRAGLSTVSRTGHVADWDRRSALQPSPRRDSLKNGAITGAIAGGLAGALLAAVGCSVGNALDATGDSQCLGGTVLLVGMGAGIGAAIGVGVDALFEESPSPAMRVRARPVGVRVRLTF